MNVETKTINMSNAERKSEIRSLLDLYHVQSDLTELILNKTPLTQEDTNGQLIIKYHDYVQRIIQFKSLPANEK